MRKRKESGGMTVLPTDKPLSVRVRKYRWMYLMYLPVFLVFLVFNYIPMAGVFIAFCDYTPFSKAPKFIGLDNFMQLLKRACNRRMR